MKDITAYSLICIATGVYIAKEPVTMLAGYDSSSAVIAKEREMKTKKNVKDYTCAKKIKTVIFSYSDGKETAYLSPVSAATLIDRYGKDEVFMAARDVYIPKKSVETIADYEKTNIRVDVRKKRQEGNVLNLAGHKKPAKSAVYQKTASGARVCLSATSTETLVARFEKNKKEEV